MNKWKISNDLCTTFFVILEGLVCWFLAQKSLVKLGAYILLSALNLGLVTWIRKMVNKKRPNHNILGKEKEGEAWPSRHSYSAFYVACSTWGIFPVWLNVFSFLTSFYLSFLRVKTKVHDFSDILAGTIMGLVSGILVSYIVQKLI